MIYGVSRRRFLLAGGYALVGFALHRRRAPRTVIVRMWSDKSGANVGFRPRGVALAPGDTVRWVVDGPNVHTSTAYHPTNGMAPLRIPRGATPWDSGFLMPPDAHFEVTFTVPGVYDYFCMPHEAMGMVGRIVVGDPGPPPYHPPPDPAWRAIPQPALDAFPAVEDIMKATQSG